MTRRDAASTVARYKTRPPSYTYTFILHLLLPVLLVFALCLFAQAGTVQLSISCFENPPNRAKPRVWWHWMNGNVSKSGITADLEAMAKAGIGGAHIFDVGCNVPPGGVAFATRAWDDHLDHAIREAERLGLELTLVNCSGFANAGGPWVAPSNSMFFVTCSETKVQGGTRPPRPLARERKVNGFYRDIAVLAFPEPKCEREAPKDVSVSSPRTDVVVFSSAQTMTLRGVKLSMDLNAGWAWHRWLDLTVETSGDGKSWQEAGKLATMVINASRTDCNVRDGAEKLLAFESPFVGRFIRFTGDATRCSHCYGDSSKVHIARLKPVFNRALPELNGRTFRTQNLIRPLTCDSLPGEAIEKARILDLTAKMSADGTLDWTAPADGDWVVLRVGYASNGVRCHPCSKFGGGLEVDKLDASAVERHLGAYALRYLGRKGVVSVLCDSYEVGAQNWTHGFERQFAARRGYSLVPYLAAFSGRVVGSARETDGVLRDYRRTVSDLFCENFAGTLSRLAARYGKSAAIEPYGNGPFDETTYAWWTSQPMTEFWVESGAGADKYGRVGYCDLAQRIASAAHLKGERFVDAEGFTASPDGGGKWLKDPFGLKAYGDLMYACGVTRMVYHRWAHQPWTTPERLPGMTMGQWGTHFERTETWWPFVGPWLKYQARCQYLLQEGCIAADLLVYAGDDAPNPSPDVRQLPKGVAWDLCGKDALAKLTVKDGKIKCLAATEYAALVVPTNVWIAPETERRFAALKQQGAKVTRDAKTLGLEEDFRASPVDAASSPRRLPKGVLPRAIHRLYDGGREGYFVAWPATNAATVTCSFRVAGKVPQLWDPETGKITTPRRWCSIHADDRSPVNVDDRATVDAASSPRQCARTEVAISFPPCGAVFVMFVPEGEEKVKVQGEGEVGAKARGEGEEKVKVEGEGERRSSVSEVALDGTWTLAFPQGWNCPEKVTLPKLVSWTEIPEGEAKYFSGIAEYSICRRGVSPRQLESIGSSSGRGETPRLQDKARVIPSSSGRGETPRLQGRAETPRLQDKARVILSLGAVKNLAEVTVNGKTFEPLWRPPYEVDVTDALRDDGVFDLKVRVANLWPNRLIGDAKKGEDCVWNGKALKEIPDWVRDGKPSPTGRLTFTTWRHWRAGDALLPSGLLGPVVLTRAIRRAREGVQSDLLQK